jgi:DNA-binding MarR family transcriptional regulator
VAAAAPTAVNEVQRLESWSRFLRAHSAVTRRLNADLIAEHGLTLNDYEVLLRLARAPEGRLRRVDLSAQVVLTPSGITRLLEGLERDGLVCRGACEEDRRVIYAHLTGAGEEKLREAAGTHLRGVDELYLSRFTEEERATLAALLGRLPGADGDADCGPSEPAAR